MKLFPFVMRFGVHHLDAFSCRVLFFLSWLPVLFFAFFLPAVRGFEKLVTALETSPSTMEKAGNMRNVLIPVLFFCAALLLTTPEGKSEKAGMQSSLTTISGRSLSVDAFDDGSYALHLAAISAAVLRSGIEAVSGGMFEIGDDLPTLGTSSERLALVRNPDLLDMARLGRASVPLDLMTYLPEDRQPSTFLLWQDARQEVFTLFNWT